MSEAHWYNAALHRSGWRDIYEDRLEAAHHHQQLMPSQEQVQCQECRRMFRREADRAWHKCVTERRKPICEQHGAVQCVNCHRWFRSRGGLSVHRCSPSASTDLNTSFSPARASETRTRNRTRPLTFQGLSQSSRHIQCQQCARGQVTKPDTSVLLKE